MGVFARLADLVGDGPIGAFAGRLAERWADARRERAGVAFTIAAIALAAKMARADGHATHAEFLAFQRLFQVPAAERANAERFYNLAKTSTAGFEAYADLAAQAIGPGSPVAEDLLAALMEIALVDGITGPEVAYMEAVAARLGLGEAAVACLKRRYLRAGDCAPCATLGVGAGATREEIKAAYRALVKRHHPDRHMADGTPPEFIRLAEARMAAINAAYAELMQTAA
jgi:DnaJ like chaperone protein